MFRALHGEATWLAFFKFQLRYHGSIPEVGGQNKLYDHNEKKIFSVLKSGIAK